MTIRWRLSQQSGSFVHLIPRVGMPYGDDLRVCRDHIRVLDGFAFVSIDHVEQMDVPQVTRPSVRREAPLSAYHDAKLVPGQEEAASRVHNVTVGELLAAELVPNERTRHR